MRLTWRVRGLVRFNTTSEVEAVSKILYLHPETGRHEWVVGMKQMAAL